MNRPDRRRNTTYFFALLATMCATACHAQDTSASAAPPANGQSVMLTMHGYNYTDHYINDYSVDDIGGGNLFLSTATSGGSGGTCCVRWTIGTKLPVKVHIRWVSGECVYNEHIGGGDFERARLFYSEQDVPLTQPPAANPQYFETHFYPDGHVEVAITDDYSPPRLKLSETASHERPGAKPWPRCTAEQIKAGGD